jgi:hypothetical protein|nr:MAG TPA: hypothetical protein [Caudoviricetes sp.]DAK80359.1 MAG TPA: hypothetical protein [Caudoviricetes sp.]DAU18205.1 MAG TPA: hypothetical protein [Caudoviricetes sp.]
MRNIIDVLKPILVGAIPLGFTVGLILFALYNEYGWILLSIILFLTVSFIIGKTIIDDWNKFYKKEAK